ncbi:MAG: purine-binding chemotaxis protein CheW, partial [Gammaproteobacteria bacterium]|nr:purine-binding chemotaxis protein CheW [Gammaproteobacteria bacterium]
MLILGRANNVNIEPAVQTTPNGPSSHDNGHPDSEGGPASGRVESISFSIGDEQYGVDIMAVREIKGWSEITHLPKQPDYVRGVLNLRGVMVPIIDLRCRFGQGKTEATALHVVIVVQVGSRLIGLLADRVLDILSFE